MSPSLVLSSTVGEVFYRTFHGPLSCRGFVLTDADGDYTVFVNEDLSDEMKRETIQHEQQHIVLGHLASERPASELEADMKKDPPTEDRS